MTNSTTQNDNSLVALEHESLSLWDKFNVFELSLEKNKNKQRYVFYDGPPFATGLPHHGHLLASTIKDIIPRYKTMHGFYVPRRFGWDCHGLPIEHEINKSLGLHAHEAVESLGITGYNQACRNIVMRYSEEWKSVIRRIGRWVDVEDDYKTMDVGFMESIWWGFSELWKKGLIYQGEKVVPYSPALSTVLSNFEAGMNYQDIQDPSLVVRIKLTDPLSGHMAHILIWTTTPWTLPANLALCVHPESSYALVKTESTTPLLIAEDRIESILGEGPHHILERYSGQALKGLTYAPLFNLDTDTTGAYQIFTDTYVSMDSGTGIVHMAPSFGEDDQRICQDHGLNLSCDPLTPTGHFTSLVPLLSGLAFKDADVMVARFLKTEDLLFHQSTIMHAYPFCPRSDTPLMYRAVPSWYVNIAKVKDDMIAANEQIHWVPSHIKQGRFGQWLHNAKDWAISRNRVWGTPMPIWINDVTQNMICMDSLATLERYSGVKLEDLHREHVDPLTFSIEGENGTYRRIEEVLDCWFESGSMPWAQHHYPFKNPDMPFSDFFPADFIAEGLDQTRGWFYTLTVLAAALKQQPAFKNVIVNGIVAAKDGKKMSKRLKNYTTPIDLMEKFGADALRLYLIHSPLVKGEEQRFSDYGVEQMARHTLLPWTHAVKFFSTYAQADEWTLPETTPEIIHPLDKWILSKCSSLIQSINAAMDDYHLHQVVPPLLHFIDDVTNTYIRMNRARFWGTDGPSDPVAFYTLYSVIKDWTICMAPFAPLISEAMYQKLKIYDSSLPLSVHLNDYPKADNNIINVDVEASIHWLQRIVTLGRHQRNEVKIPIKTPLNLITIVHKDPYILTCIQSIQHLVLTELNVKKMALSSSEHDYVDLLLKPQSRILGKRLGTSFKAVLAALKALSTSEIIDAETQGFVIIGTHRIEKEEWTLERVSKASNVMTDGHITLQLDTTLDKACILEGQAREVMSYIQKYRKHLDLPITQRIHLKIFTDELSESARVHKTTILQETLCLDIEILPTEDKVDDAFMATDTLFLQIHQPKS